MPLTGPVLVATDLTPPADEALRQGAALADGLGSSLAVVHVVPELSQVRVLFPHLAGADEAAFQELVATARGALAERVRAEIGRTLPDKDVIVEVGGAPAGIAAAADRHGAGTIVLGPGPTAARLAHHARWAVMVARPAPPGGAVLAATDFSDPALPAIAVAVGEARRRGVPLRLLHAVDVDLGASPTAFGPPTMLPVPSDAAAALVDAARADLERALEHFGVAGQAVVARGPAASAIVADATMHPTALVVVGTHGRSGLRRFLLGSVADGVLRSAPCSVAAVPLRQVDSPPEVSAA
ncbi:MAG: universal stress protein [Vicinamibacterales bacterium]